MITKLQMWIVGALLLLIVAGGTVGYIRWDAVQDERAKVERQAAEDYRKLSERYSTLSEKYNKLKAVKETKRQEQVVKEDKIIHENREYYAGDCLDAVGLQHVQAAQRAVAK